MTQNANTVPPPVLLFQLMTGPWAAQAVATVARLGIPDLLTGGPRTAADLATNLKVNPNALFRVLRGVAMHGVLKREGDKFGLTPAGELLKKDAPNSMRSFVIALTMSGHWLPWAHLDESVRTDSPSTQTALGMHLWDHYKTNPVELQYFTEAMSALSSSQFEAIHAAYSFADAKKVIDVGGAQGAFVSSVLGRVPTAKGMLFDLPEVVEAAGPALKAKGLADRIERVGGSFFESVPSGGDVYLLKHVLHDWKDAECLTILKNIRKAMGPESRLVVAEMLIDESRIVDGGPVSLPVMADLNMLVIGGKERTEEEFAKLFTEAGMRLAKAINTPAEVAVLEARPV